MMTSGLLLFAGLTEDVLAEKGLARRDPANLRFFVNHRGPALVRTARWTTQCGSVPVLLLLAAGAATVLWWRCGTALVVALLPGVALFGAGISTAVAKHLVARARPPTGLRLVVEGDSSFPSGHTTAGTAFYLVLAAVFAIAVLRRPLARLAMMLLGIGLPAVIGLGRLTLGAHWPTDVVAGWSLGTAIAAAALLLGWAAAQRSARSGLDRPV